MSELKWQWVYYPYLDAPNKQEESALKAGYIKVVIKDEADKVIAELKDDVTYWKKVAKKNMDDNVAMARERAKAFESERHHKYKRCLAMAGRCRLRGRLFGACGLYEKELWALKWHKRWLELAEKFKEAK